MNDTLIVQKLSKIQYSTCSRMPLTKAPHLYLMCMVSLLVQWATHTMQLQCMPLAPVFDDQGHRSPALLVGIQALVPAYRITCNGTLLQWGIATEKQGQHNIHLQVWRPIRYGAYSLIGVNTFNLEPPSGQKTFILTPILSNRITVQDGDVIGFHLEKNESITDEFSIQYHTNATGIDIHYMQSSEPLQEIYSNTLYVTLRNAAPMIYADIEPMPFPTETDITMRQGTTSIPTSTKHTLQTTETNTRQTTKTSDQLKNLSTESTNHIVTHTASGITTTAMDVTTTTMDVTTTANDDMTTATDVMTTAMGIPKQTIDITSIIYSSSNTEKTTTQITNDKLFIVILIAIIGMTVGIVVISTTVAAIVIRCTIKKKKEETNDGEKISKQYVDEEFDYTRAVIIPPQGITNYPIKATVLQLKENPAYEQPELAAHDYETPVMSASRRFPIQGANCYNVPRGISIYSDIVHEYEDV